MDLLGRAPDELISPDDVRHRHAVGGAVVEEVVGRIDREWERHRWPAVIGLAFLNREAAPDGVVRLRAARTVREDGGERHAVGMLGETGQGVETAFGGGIEANGALPA